MTSAVGQQQDKGFLSRLGHELRTPLNAVIGFSSLLQREANLTQRQRERLATVEQSGKSLLERVDRLLKDARIEQGDYVLHGAPIAAPPASSSLRRTAARTDSPGRVLVIDDTAANVQLLTEVLQAQGHVVFAAADGDTGIEIAQRHAPDVILLDVQMHGLGGFETCGVLKSDPRTADIPVIFMTVITYTAAKVAAFEAGAADYVTKPFHIDEAIARVNTQIRLTQSQRQLARLNAELEARVRQRTAQLEAAHRDLQSFCYSIAHDLRGPLGALDGFSKLLEEMLESTGDKRTRHYLGRIRGGVKQMDGLTDALLTLAHLSLREHFGETVDIGLLAGEAIERHRAAEPGRSVRVDIEAGLVVQADRSLMKLLVDHLVDNAWKFTRRANEASIHVGRSAKYDAGIPVFFVRDNGTGFDMAYADKLFRPFQRLHGSADFAGLGIGLAIVERIVQRHGGRVWAEASPGAGACVYFTVPGQSSV